MTGHPRSLRDFNGVVARGERKKKRGKKTERLTSSAFRLAMVDAAPTSALPRSCHMITTVRLHAASTCTHAYRFV